MSTVRLSSSARRLPPLPVIGADDVLLCDGIEQLRAMDVLALRMATRRARGLVVTSHHPVRWCPTVHECATTPALLAELLDELGETMTASRCAELLSRHGGNVRAVLRDLYDDCATS